MREEVAFDDLRSGVAEPARLHYRNRRHNVERKMGNIADFCGTWGGNYRYMIVLDADSVMTGACLVNLVRFMEDHPGAGIVQAPPLPVNRRSLFGRFHQFALHTYSPIFMAGLNSWQGGAGNYWGHNAIIRIRPFIDHCRLPRLPGEEPLGARSLFWWLSPFLAGLLLSVPLSVWTSRASAGEWARARGLLLTTAEAVPPVVLRRLEEEIQWAAARPWAVRRDGLSWVLEDQRVLARHIALLPPPEPPDPVRRHLLQGLSLKLRRDGPEALDRREKRALLLDADSIRALAGGRQ